MLLIFTGYQSRVRPDWLKVTITSNNPHILYMAGHQQVSMLLAASREREQNLPVFLIIIIIFFLASLCNQVEVGSFPLV